MVMAIDLDRFVLFLDLKMNIFLLLWQKMQMQQHKQLKLQQEQLNNP